mmetsp:Transcript_27316/g.43868  ORF Transcript_27316/g.43868 Transcript_27316/m.43868 type:complete len:99 (+) Transcript_27316:1-297(+)
MLSKEGKSFQKSNLALGATPHYKHTRSCARVLFLATTGRLQIFPPPIITQKISFSWKLADFLKESRFFLISGKDSLFHHKMTPHEFKVFGRFWSFCFS